MKTDANDDVVDVRTATFAFLAADVMDEERLYEAMNFINAERAALAPSTHARLCDRVAWHIRQIGQYHLDLAVRLEGANREYPHPRGLEVARRMRHEAQERFELADSWTKASAELQARARRKQLHVVPTQLPLPLEEAER